MRKIGSAELAGHLRRAILDRELLTGDRLPPERELAETHGISRGTVREALAKLAREDLVEIRRGSGAFITHTAPLKSSGLPLENARPLELMDARFALEPHMCRLAVLHATKNDFQIMEDLLEQMEASMDDPDAFAAADGKWHAALAQSTGNNLLIGILAQINAVRVYDEWTRMRRLTLGRATISKYNAQHRQIVNALRSREPERAAKLMKEHLETARLSLTRVAAT